MAKKATGRDGFNGTSEQRQRNLDHDEYSEETRRSPDPAANDGGKVIHVDPEENRPVTVTLPPEKERGRVDLERDLGSEFLF
jgi:hypothetical protein